MIGVNDKTAKAWVLDYMAYFSAKVDNSLENKEVDLKNDNN